MSTDTEKLIRYIRDMSREMAKMANGASLESLAYLLSLVVLEAESRSAASSENSAAHDLSL